MAQRYFKHKMTLVLPLSSALGDGKTTISLALQQVGGQGVHGFDEAPRWAATFKNYE